MLPIFIVVAAALAVAVVLLLVAYRRASRRASALTLELADARQQSAQQTTDLDKRAHLDTLKDEFISTVSHELRTPLTSIRGALGLLSGGMMGPVDDKAANLLRIASSNTDRLVRLINDILDLERMDSGQAPMQLRRCFLRELVLQAVDTMRSMADAAGVQLEIVPETADSPVLFKGDPDRMEQVLCNLLSNAIKFSPAGSVVRVITSATVTEVVLRVEDAGRGVPADKLATIFDRFAQVDPGDARRKGGTGLGLAICRTIINQHNGELWAERNDSAIPGLPGTTFSIRLPRLEAATEVLPLPVSPEGAVLVVDDDAGVRHVVAEHLRHNGYTVLEAERGEAAIQIASQEPIEAILLDLYMPGLSGWETLERLKRDPATSQIPVVILSVLSPTARVGEGTSVLSAAQGWVQKPFNESLLLAELGRVLHSGSGPGRILLVEDDDDLATVVMSSFENAEESSGVSVEHVSSMGDAQSSCSALPPDIMILDLTLPDGTGFALVDWLRRQPALRTLPLVVYSGRDVTAGEMEQLRLGPTQFLAKARVQPRDVENLVLAMVRHLRNPTNALSSPGTSA